MKAILAAIGILIALAVPAAAQDSCSFGFAQSYRIASDHNPSTQAWDVAAGAYVTQSSDAGYQAYASATYGGAGNCDVITQTQTEIFAEVNRWACSNPSLAGSNQPGDTLSSNQTLTNPVALTQFIGFSGTSYKVTLPQANLPTSTCIGRPILFKNIGASYAFSYEIDAYGGGTVIAALPIGGSAYVVLEANSSAAGTWTSVTFYDASIDNAVIGANAPAAVTATELNATQDINLSGDLTPTALSGDVNNYAPAGVVSAFTLRIDGGASDRNITGINTSQASGRLLRIINIGTTNNVTLINQSGSSTAANRFLLPADTVLPINTAIVLQYDTTASRWRPWSRSLSNTGVTAGSYGSTTKAPVVTVDSAGRVTAASEATIVLGPTQGGTGIVAYVTGDTVYGSGTNILSVLAGNTTTTKKFLSQTGSGPGSAAPSWLQVVAGDLPAFGSGDVSFASGGGAGTIANAAVTNAKHANMAAHTYSGNNTGSAAAPIDLTIAQVQADIAAGMPQVTAWQGGYKAGRYYTGPGGNTSTLAAAANTIYFMPLQVSASVSEVSHTFDRCAFEVTTAGTAANFRMAIYTAVGGVPSALVLDCGSTGVAGTGVKTTTVSQALTPGAYWLAINFDGTDTIAAGPAGTFSAFQATGLSSFSAPDGQLSATFTFGAFPATMTFGSGGVGAATYTNGTIPALGVRG